MSRPAIVVDGLSKSYRLGVEEVRPDSLREAVTNTLLSPFRRFRELKESAKADPGAFWALKDVSFSVQPGEVVGIIGRNGAGKSTLLKALSRIVEPTEGEIRLRGRMASLLEVGTGFHPELTGRENIFLNGSILGMKHAEIARKFDEIVDFSGVEKFLDTPVKRYSSGMYVRLAFSVAAHLEPEILIIDEVLAVGDSAFQQKCLGKVKSLTRGGGRTVLFVSHNLTTVRALCERVIWLRSGRIAWDGPAGPAIDDYLLEDMGGGANSFELDRVPRDHFKETPVRVTSVTFNGGEPIRHGEPLSIEIGYRASRDIEGVAFGVAFSNLEGARIVAIDSDIPNGRRLDVKENDEGKLVMTIAETLFQPCRYFVGIGVHTGDSHGLDLLPAFGQVEVLGGPRTTPFLIGRNEAGCVRIPSETTYLNPSGAPLKPSDADAVPV